MNHTLSVLVENRPGVLARAAGLFSRRGFNIQSLAVSTTEQPDTSRMTIVVEDEGKPAVIEQIGKQLYKLMDVIKVMDHTDEPVVSRELSLIKLNAEPSRRGEIMQVASIFRANIVDVAERTFIIEVTGSADKIDAFEKMLEPYGIVEMARTGRIVLARGSKTT